jgi:hypothetical protein
MHKTLGQIRNITFFALVSIFSLFLVMFLLARRLAAYRLDSLFMVIIVLAIVYGVLGLVLLILTVKLHEPWIRKVFFLLTAVSSAGIPVFGILHNLVYGLLLWWLGEGFWERHGTDEPFFFILALFVCPALFLIGTVGCIVLLIKARLARQ